MRLCIGLIALLLATPVRAEDKPVVAPAPAWVVPWTPPKSATAPEPATTGDAPVKLIHIEHQLRFGVDADERYFESAVKILTPQGLAAMGTIALPWKPDSSTLTIHKLRILRGAETIDLLAGGKQFTVLRREEKLESAIMDGMLTATIQPEGIQVGDIVEFAYTLRYRDPVLRNHSEFSFELPPAMPDTQVRVSAIWPAGMTIAWRKSDVMPAPRIWKDKAGNHLSVELASLSTLVQPKGAPARFMPVRRLDFTSFASWGDLVSAMVPLYEQAAVIPKGSPLEAEVAKIKADESDPKRRAGAALKLVQDRIRYVYLGMNTGNLMPAAAADTWSRRFGDCKGKTALLLAILHALDIDAVPAVVSSQGGDGLDARLPMAALFDHIIVRAHIAGKTYWLDGTRIGDGDLDRVVVPPFRWALPIVTGNSALAALVQAPLDKPSTLTTVAIDASKGIALPAPVTVTKIMRGDEALQLRQQLSIVGGADLDKALRQFWKSSYSFITPDKVGASFDEKTGEETLTLAGKADLEWDSDGYELDGARLGWDQEHKRDPGANADAPIQLSFPFYEENRETIKLPRDGRGFFIKGENVDKTIAGYVLSRHSSIKDGVLTMVASSRTLQPELPYAEALAAVAPLKELGKVRVWVRAPADYADTGNERVAALEKKPTDAAGYVERGYGFLDEGLYDKAIADFTQAIGLDNNNALAFADRGIAHAWKDETNPALDDLDQAAALNPRLAQVFHGRAIVLEKMGDTGGALAALTRAIGLEGENLWALGRRATLYLARGASDKALADTDAMVKIQADNVEALFLRARIQAAAGDNAAALATLATLAKARPDASGIESERAFVLARMGKAEEARALFAGLRAKAGQDAELLNELCWQQGRANLDLDHALADCEAALKLKPDTVAYLDSAGLALLRMGRFDQAIDRYSKALAKSPNEASSLYGRGIAELRKGDAKASDADLRAAAGKSATVASDYAGFGVKP